MPYYQQFVRLKFNFTAVEDELNIHSDRCSHRRLCGFCQKGKKEAGPLSAQLTKAYFNGPNQSVTTKYIFDISLCLAEVINGKADAIMSPFPDEKYFPALIDTNGDRIPDTNPHPLIRSIDTNLVAGTPYWVALDDECDRVK